MTIDLTYLAATALLTANMWLFYSWYICFRDESGNLSLFRGAVWGNRHKIPQRPLWIERAERAHKNAIENLVVFAALILICHAAGLQNEMTANIAIAFFWVRLGHWISYMLGIVYIRSFLFMTGWGLQLWLAAIILTQ